MLGCTTHPALLHAVLFWRCQSFPVHSDSKTTGNSPVLHPPLTFRAQSSKDQASHYTHLGWPAATQTAPCWAAAGSEPWGHCTAAVAAAQVLVHTTSNTYQASQGWSNTSYPLCGSCFSFPANCTVNTRSWPLSELFQSLALENLKDWAKILTEEGSQPPTSSGEGNGQANAKGNPAPLQGSKKHHYSPHSSWWRLNFFDLVITNRDDSKVNQTK